MFLILCGREAALAWASLAQRFPASSVLAREGAGCGSVGDVPGAWLIKMWHGQINLKNKHFFEKRNSKTVIKNSPTLRCQ